MEAIDNTQIGSETKNEYAGFWVRAAGMMIDLSVIAFLFNQINWQMREQLQSYFIIHPDVADKYADVFGLRVGKYEMATYFSYYISMILSFFLQWLYYAGMESSPLKATLGKWAVGAYVTDLDGGRISFAKATGRYFGKIISGLILGIGYLMAGFSNDKQALHDQMAGCFVWRK